MQDKKLYDAVALGELLADLTEVKTDADGYPTLEAHPGGAPANYLAALAKFGAETAMIGKVGADAFGRALRATLEKAGVDTRGVIVDENVFTTLAFVTLDEAGNREFSFARKPGADTRLAEEELDFNIIGASRVFHFGTLSLTDEPARTATKRAVEYAKERGVTVTFDPNLRKPLWRDLNEAKKQMLWGLSQADIVKISDEETDFLFGCSPEDGAARIIDDFGAKLVFATCGEKGCYYKNRNASGSVTALSGVRAVDTTGAGDIFGGSAVWRWLQTGKSAEELDGDELREIALFAAAVAGLSTEKPGGISSVPSLSEVTEKLRAASQTVHFDKF